MSTDASSPQDGIYILASDTPQAVIVLGGAVSTQVPVKVEWTIDLPGDQYTRIVRLTWDDLAIVSPDDHAALCGLLGIDPTTCVIGCVPGDCTPSSPAED